MVAWAALSPEDVAYAQPYLFLLGCGFQFALLMGRIILGHLCDEHDGMLAAMWQSLAPLPLAVANAASGAARRSYYQHRLHQSLTHARVVCPRSARAGRAAAA